MNSTKNSPQVSSKFTEWYINIFRNTDLFKEMSSIKEDSPYHREDNIGMHTHLVVHEYLQETPLEWTKNNLNGALACAFHDVGKPSSVVYKYHEDRGNYKAFYGHEVVSARLWEDWVISNWEEFTAVFDTFTVLDIFKVGWMIEHHRPWDIKKQAKLLNIASTMMEFECYEEDFGGFSYFNMLLSDTKGRISDNEIIELEESKKWIGQLQHLLHNIDPPPLRVKNQPILKIIIAPSGAGKSTFIKKHLSKYDIFSYDLLRLEWHGNDYNQAFESSIKDKKFRSRSQTIFVNLIKARKNIVIDNVNTSIKSRRFFINTARQHGYYVQAILLPVSLQTILDRQHTRSDKTIPETVVKNQYYRLQLPQYGELDNIKVLNSNLS